MGVDVVEQRQAAAVGEVVRDHGQVVVPLVDALEGLLQVAGDADVEAQFPRNVCGRMHEGHIVLDDEQRRCAGMGHGVEGLPRAFVRVACCDDVL